MARLRPSQIGFTLVELLVVIGIIGLLFTLVTPVVSSTTRRNDFAVTVTTSKQLLRQAQILAKSGHHDDGWGVNMTGDKITLFKGAFGAQPDFNEEFEIPSGINITGDTEIKFSKFSGTTTGGTINFTSDFVSLIETVTVNEEGAVE